MRSYLQTGFFIGLLFLTSLAQAQTPFWVFDANNNEVDIPVQCDGQFDETRGGVIMPTPEDLFEHGEIFMQEKGNAKNGAAYCFLAAALQGHLESQFRVAQLYNKGIILPQNELAAYKWAFIAALNGHHEAEQMALTLEQYLSTEDISLATQSIEGLIPMMTDRKKSELMVAESNLDSKRAHLEDVNKEIDNLLGVKFTPPVIEKPSDKKENKEEKK